MVKNLIIVGIGGALGSIARFLCQKFLYEWFPQPFPWGTLSVNISGCFLIGIFYAMAEKGNLLTPEWRLFLTTGLCGGFTTFSSFAYESINLLKSADYSYLLLYTSGSVILGILASIAGMAVMKLI